MDGFRERVSESCLKLDWQQASGVVCSLSCKGSGQYQLHVQLQPLCADRPM
jgi:hypothetical protein